MGNHYSLTTLTFVFLMSLLNAQNTLSIPFGNGFVGVNTGGNSSGSAYYLTGAQGLGWSNIQFAQNTTGNVFVAQGNDIIGFVKITDFNGVQHEIPGFIKWRTPSGNNPHTICFEPSPGTFTLATNSFNGSAQYVIDDTKYIGLTKIGETLTISPVPGTVTGNAATSGLLNALNDILAALPKLTITGTSIFESDGIATVTIDLDAASTDIVIVNFTTISNSALSGADYDSTHNTISFQPGELVKTIDIPITIDSLSEATEFFNVQIFDSEYAAITSSSDTVFIAENTLLPVVLLYSNINCDGEISQLNWGTASERNCAFYEIELSTNGLDWKTIGALSGNGNTSELSTYSFTVYHNTHKIGRYFRIKQVDLDGEWEYFAILTSPCNTTLSDYKIYPNPAKQQFTLQVESEKKKMINYVLIDTFGKIVLNKEHLLYPGLTELRLNVSDNPPGVYKLQLNSPDESIIKTIQLL